MRVAAGAAAPRLVGQRAIALFGLLALAAGVLLIGGHGWRQGALFLIGALLGVSLYHGGFGFTAAWRNAIRRRDIAGVLAQLVMLGVAMLLFAPLLADGELFGRRVVGALAPAGFQVAIGSCLFGLGMQLGGGCGSGTLYTVGGGSARMVLTLVAFCAGAFAGSLDLGRYAGLPSLGTVSLANALGYPLALALQLGALAAVWLALRRWTGETPQRLLWDDALSPRRLLQGPWPLLLSALMLALLNFATLVVAGHPWTVTWGFTLWGAKVATLLGWEPATNAFWTGGFAARALQRGVLEDAISVMDLGIMLGALTAAGLAGRFAPSFRIPLRSALAALLGGLLMGYGARLAYGCNIGAFFSGVVSFSLHGWLWIVFALAGSWLGVRLRPRFGLHNGL